MIRSLALIAVLLLAACSGGWEERYALGREKDGARYYSGGMLGGPSLFVHPSGTVQWRYESGGAIVRDRYTYIDKALWARLRALVETSGGVDVEDREDPEIGMCDGGTEMVYIKSGDRTGYYYFDSGCEGNVWRSDKAGREALPILEAISDEFDLKSRQFGRQ